MERGDDHRPGNRAEDGEEGRLRRAYQLLGLDPGADLTEIRRAWRALVRSYHPDTVKHDKEAANAKLAELNSAYDAVRAAHDADRHSGQMRRPRVRRRAPARGAASEGTKEDRTPQVAQARKVLTEEERQALLSALAGFSAAHRVFDDQSLAKRAQTDLMA